MASRLLPLTALGLILAGGAWAAGSTLPAFFQATFEAVREAPLRHRDRREPPPAPALRVAAAWTVAGASPLGALSLRPEIVARLDGVPPEVVSELRPAADPQPALAVMPAVFLADIPRPPTRPILMPTAAAYASVMPTSGLLAALSQTLMAPQTIVIPQPTPRPGDALRAGTLAPAQPETRVAMLGGMPGAGIAIGRLAEASRMAAIVRGACSVPEPFKVTALGPNGRTALEPAATLDPQMMERLGPYEGDVQASAKNILGEPIRAFRVAASYDCRTMNHRRRAHLSEHAHANAVDIAGFQTASGEWITVKADFHGGGRKEAFLKAVHQETCDRFQVVLGPGSDGMHEDHFHMDLGNWKRCR